MTNIQRLIPLLFSFTKMNGFHDTIQTQYEPLEHGFLIETTVAVRALSELGEREGKPVILEKIKYGYKARLLHFGRVIRAPLTGEHAAGYTEGMWNSSVQLYSLDIGGLQFTASLVGSGKKVTVPSITRKEIIQHGYGHGSWKEEINKVQRGRDGKVLVRPRVILPKYLCITLDSSRSR